MSHLPVGCFINAPDHGTVTHDTFRAYSALLGKCYYPNVHKGRRPAMTPRWHTFAGFLMDMGRRPATAKLVLIDSTQPYSKENCAWK